MLQPRAAGLPGGRTRPPECKTLNVDLRGVLLLGAGGVRVLEMTRLCAAHRNTRLAAVAHSRAVLRALQIADEIYGVGVLPTVPAAGVGTEAPRRPPARPLSTEHTSRLRSGGPDGGVAAATPEHSSELKVMLLVWPRTRTARPVSRGPWHGRGHLRPRFSRRTNSHRSAAGDVWRWGAVRGAP